MSTQSRFVTQLQDKLSGRFPGFAEKLPGYLQLIRFDKPIGVLLLLWPTITALWIAAEGLPDLDLLVIFLLGTYIMRAAGCAINDYADYKFDGGVTRTRERPLATGILRRQDALNAFLVLSGIGFFLVLLTNMQTILLSFGAVVVAAIYPFMKRFTNLPQVILGIAFSWGILMAFTAQTEALPPVAFLLFVANCLWTVAYDTEYAMVDRDDDLQLGIKSTAILFGTADRMMIFILQLPLLFWSNSLYPLATLPIWMRVGAMLNPTTYVVTGLRTITMAPSADVTAVDTIATWICFVVIAAFAASGMGLALRAFKSAIK